MLSVSAAIVVLAVPGLLTGLAAGLRGWALAGLAPLLSYAIGGLAGPWTAALGLPFNAWTYAAAAVVFAAIAFGARKLAVRRRPPEPEPGVWARRGHLAVVACLLVAAATGLTAALLGMGRLGALPQGFDAVYHGNAVRYIADTGDGGLFGTSQMNWYGDAAPVFYPNGYHLLASVTYRLSGASIPETLDANTVLLPGLLALSLVTLVREFRGRAVLAGAVALTAVAPVMGVYESMDRGPLLPFALGVALTPLAAVALHRYLERPAPDTGLVLVLAAVGLLCVHSSTLFGGILFAGPLLVQRWLTGEPSRWRRLGRDLLALLPIAVASLVVAWLQLSGALGLATGAVPYYGWPSEYRASTALGALLGFQHFEPHPQVWLSVALFLGIVFFARAGALRWIGLTAAVTGLAYIAVASSNAPLVMALSRPWWDDPYRFFSMAAIPLSVLAAHGLASTQAWLRDRLPARIPAAAVAAVVLLGFVLLSNGLYVRSNGDRVYTGYQAADPAKLRTTPGEIAAMGELGRLARPGEWAMNDRFDGTAWTYALSGIRTVAGHFDETLPPKDAQLLADRFHDYPTDPDVRAAVRRLNIHWVILGKPSTEPGKPYQPGLLGLAGAPFLQEAFRNADAVIYRLVA